MAHRSKQQLLGIRILVGRARHQASVLSSALRDLGAEVIEIPFIEIRKPRSFKALDQALRELQSYDWMIFTSVNGVDAVWTRAEGLGLHLRQPKHLKVAAIGPVTKSAIAKRGFSVDVRPKQYVAEAVVKSLRRRVKGKRVLLMRARVARDVIPEELRKAGASVDVVEVYETVIPEAGSDRMRAVLKNKDRRPQIITFTSSSTVRNFATLLKGGEETRSSKEHLLSELNGILFASIGPVTSGTLRELGLDPHIEARAYTIPGLVKAIVSHGLLPERVTAGTNQNS